MDKKFFISFLLLSFLVLMGAGCGGEKEPTDKENKIPSGSEGQAVQEEEAVTASGWKISTVKKLPYWENADMAVDSEGNPHMVYQHEEDKKGAESIGRSFLGFDEEGTPHIVYELERQTGETYRDTETILKYASKK